MGFIVKWRKKNKNFKFVFSKTGCRYLWSFDKG